MVRRRKYRGDFSRIKREVPLEKILSHYGVVEGMKRVGSQLTGCCPIHDGSNRKQFVVNLEKNAWRCFGDCDRGGGTLELVAEMERVDIAEAAQRVAGWFGIKTADGAHKERRTAMTKNQKPTYKVYAVQEPGSDGETGAFWTRIGSAWPHADGKGLNLVFSVLPVNGRLVLRAYSEEPGKQDDDGAARRDGACTRCDD